MQGMIQSDIPEALPIKDKMGREYALHLYDDDATWILKAKSI
jgi:hypothetical protein